MNDLHIIVERAFAISIAMIAARAIAYAQIAQDDLDHPHPYAFSPGNKASQKAIRVPAVPQGPVYCYRLLDHQLSRPRGS
jgi:hypothetical protein